MNSNFSNINNCNNDDNELIKLLTYIQAVYYNINMDHLKKLTKNELTAFYRSLVFYFITTMDKQPDGGWYGNYWSKHILDEGPRHNKTLGSTNMTSQKIESFYLTNLCQIRL